MSLALLHTARKLAPIAILIGVVAIVAARKVADRAAGVAEVDEMPAYPPLPSADGLTPPATVLETVKSLGRPPEAAIVLLRDGGRSVWGIEVDRKAAEAAWISCRARTEATGLYPLIVARATLASLANDDGYDQQSAEEVVVKSGAIDVPSWNTQRYKDAMSPDEKPDFAFPVPFTPDPDGFVMLESDDVEPGPFYLALIPTTRPWEVFAHLRFGGWNDSPDPEFHVAVARRWNQMFGAEPVVMGSDLIEMIVARPPTSIEACRALAIEQFAYTAGDAVHQGTGTFGALAAELRARKHWFFWWD